MWRLFVIQTVAVVSLLSASRASADDWLTYRHDPTRSGVSQDVLAVESLVLSWSWKSPSPPVSAWSAAAKWDAYAGIRGLRSMRDYDPVFAVVATEDSMFFGSSIDDSVRCLDLKTGNVRWVFTSDGPIRIAPCFSYGNVYFGSDDGHAYCLDAESGELVWKINPIDLARANSAAGEARPRNIINNQRAIPFWPIRSGVTVVDGTAYFAASMLPWKKSYLCAVDAQSGKPDGDGHFVREMAGQTMEGAIAVSPGRLVVPQGRVPPVLFNRTTGDSLGPLEGGGGCFVVVSPRGTVFHGPGNKTGWITSSNGSSRETIATYNGGNVLCLDGDESILLTDTVLAATNFREKKLLWKVDCSTPLSMILARNVVICGGTDIVVAYDRTNGKTAWQAQVDGHVHGLAISNGNLLVSTDTGEISCFFPGEGTVPEKRAAVQIAPLAEPPATIARSADKGLLSQWNFHPGFMKEGRLVDLAGRLDIGFKDRPRFTSLGQFKGLSLLDGPGGITVRDRYQDAGLPTAALSAEAWVRVDKTQKWGGIVGAIQDNGSYERGWILGYTENKFSFAVASEKEPTVLTYLLASAPFTPGTWYHVVGTYDGTTMKIFVDGELKGTSTAQSGPISYPPKARFELAAYHDDDENFPLDGMLHEVRIYDVALDPELVKKHAALRQLSDPVAAKLSYGPYLTFLDSRSAAIRWGTELGVQSSVELRLDAEQWTITSDSLDGEHEVILTGLKGNRQYQYQLAVTKGDATSQTMSFECDTFFNYGLTPPTDAAMEFGATGRPLARAITRTRPPQGGLCVVLGLKDGTVAAEVAIQSQMRVIAFDDNLQRVERLRRELLQCGLYGSRVAIHYTPTLSQVPLTGLIANMVFSERLVLGEDHALDWNEAYRLLRPNGGILVTTAADGDRQDDNEPLPLDIRRHETGELELLVGQRRPLPGAGEWSHLYGMPNNSAFGGESLQGLKQREDLQVQWVGRPGARYQPDRNGRKPSPLSIGGRLYLQGLNRILALDAYNGSILWSLEIPSLGRFNMPRDCSNWCADEDYLYVAIDGECWQIDGTNGNLNRRFKVQAGAQKDWNFHWGYVASTDKLLLGSAVKDDAPFRNFWGGADAGWYDAKGGDATGKICSDRLFAYDKKTGDVVWSYSNGILINPTMTASSDRVFFVESRNPDLVASPQRRVFDDRLWEQQFLVALDRKTGKKIWEYSLATEPGTVVYYLAHSGDKLSLVSSSKKQYHVYVFDAEEGAANWEQHFPWPSDNHGGHMSRPAIVGDTLYVRPRAYDLNNGTLKAQTVPLGGCGTYAATSGALFFRSGNVTVWDREKGTTTAWNRLRPDCWLSTIPAGGMLLSPEGGGGCSCGSWMETSIGFIPRVLLKK